MFNLPGRSPHKSRCRSLSLFQVFAARLLPYVVLLFTASAAAQTPLTLAEAERIALDAEAGIVAIEASADKLLAESIIAGELPDPQLRVGMNNYPIESGDFTTEGMTHAALAIRQNFPAGRTRQIKARQLELRAGGRRLDADRRERDVLTDVRNAWLDVFYWERSQRLLAESRDYFADLVEITRSLYSVGRKDQQDLLRAELELSRLGDRLIEVDMERQRARASLGEWVGEEAGRPLPPSLGAPGRVPPLERMRALLSEHPVFLGLDTAIEATDAGVELARQRRKPGWAVDLGYSYRDGSLPDGSPRSDFVSLNVTVDLPFFSRESIDSSLNAALHERSAARASREQMWRRLAAELDAAYARWQQTGRRLELYDRAILGQSREHAEATLLAYQNDRSDFADVMRAYIDELNTRINHIRLQVEQARSFAVLANLGGLSR